MLLIETTVSVHRLPPSALRGSGSEGRASACSSTAAVSAGDWHPSDASVLEIPVRLDGKTAEKIPLMSEQHLISCCRSDAPEFFRASADWTWKKKWMRLWSNASLSLLRMRSDLEDSSLLLSKRPTLCGSVGDAGRTPCCWKMSLMIVGFFFFPHFLKFLQHFFLTCNWGIFSASIQ